MLTKRTKVYSSYGSVV